jgi:hypothetical protein
MVELVDTPDLKSCALLGVRVQVPLRVLKPLFFREAFFILKHLQRGFHPEFVGLPNFHELGFFYFKKSIVSQHFPNISKFTDSINFSSPVDLEYFQLIKDKIRTDALWVISYFQEMEKKDKIEKICNIGVTPSSIIMKTMNEI